MRRRSPVVSSAARNLPASNLSTARRSREFRPHLLALSLASAFAVSPVVLANPTGGVAVQGSATFVNSGNQLTVTTQNGAGLNHSAINWQSFSIPAGSTTSFVQPSTTSTVINNVITNNPSAIFGTLQSNGRVVLVNQSGITVGAGAVVDTAGFTASALGMSQDDAKAGRMRFGSSLGGSTGAIQVQGNIIARGGDVVLIAPSIEVAKTAVVEAPNGSAILAAGQKVEVTGRGLEGIVMEVQAPSDKAVNLGTLRGDAVGIFAGQLRHSGLIQANGVTIEGGRVVLKATDLAEVDGTIQASKTVNGVTSGGSVKIDAPIVTTNGTIQASGVTGGTVEVTGGVILQGGRIEASGTQTGGDIKIVARNYVEQTASTKIVAEGGTGAGGNVTIQATEDGASILSSAEVSADGAQGGTVKISAPSIGMYAASVHADGTAETNGTGGSLEIGGGFHGGDPYLPNSRYVFINSSSVFSASSRRNGAGGTVALWSDGDMKFSGLVKALGGAVSGNGGFIEVSGKENLVFRGMADASAVNGAAGTLLLDPTNITITEGGASGGTLMAVALNRDETGLGDSSSFGDSIQMKNGVLVITDPNANLGGISDAGAIFVFDASTGALRGVLHGSHNGDEVGSTYYGYGDYNINNTKLMWYGQNWNNGAGALTVFDPLNLVGSMVVSSGNSFVGNTGDALGNGGVVVVNGLTSKSIVLGTTNYGGGAGAITILNSSFETIGAGGVSGANAGTLSSANSLVGTGTSYEYFGSVSGSGTQIYSDANNSYGGASGGFYFDDYIGSGKQDGFLIVNDNWNNGKGAVVFASTSGVAPTGLVGSGTNTSFRGANDDDHIGQNVYYTNPYAATDWLIGSPHFDYLGMADAGAMTYISHNVGLHDTINAGNSVVGSHAGDALGDLEPLFDVYYASGKYILRSSSYNGGYGAVGLVSFTQKGVWETGLFNITTGATDSDQFGADGSSFYLTNSAGFMQIEKRYNGGEGGVFWYNDDGTQAGKLTGGLANGPTSFGATVLDAYENQVIINQNWTDDSSNANKGSITVVNRFRPQTGIVDGFNSIIGANAEEKLGSGSLSSLSYAGGEWYAAFSPNWNTGKGAYTFISQYSYALGSQPHGVIGGSSGDAYNSNTFSVVGADAGDLTSSYFYSLSGGGQVALLSPSWSGNKGAITMMDLDFFNGTVGSIAVDYTTSLVGSQTGDHIADNVGRSSDSNYLIVKATNWGGGKGAVAALTFDGSTGLSSRTGVMGASNSLVGTFSSDAVGTGLVTDFSYNDTRYLFVSSPNWGETLSAANGAVTVISLSDLATSVSFNGTVSQLNSTIGQSAGDHFGPTTSQTNHLALEGSSLLVASPNWRSNKGAVAWLDMANPTGRLGPAQMLTGTTSGDVVGNLGFIGPNVIGSASYRTSYDVLISSAWNGGRGAITAVGSAPPTGNQVSALNSFVGAEVDDAIGSTFDSAMTFDNGAIILRSGEFKQYGGAYTLFTGSSDMTGTLDATNSIVGNAANDLSNSQIVTRYLYGYGNGNTSSLGNYAVLQQSSWNDGMGGTEMGSVRIINTDVRATAIGDTNATNALVGTHDYDHVGADGLYVLQNGRVAVTSLDWNSGQQAFTVINPVAPTVGGIDSSNSLLSNATGEGRNMNIQEFSNGNFLLNTSGYGNDQGAITFFDQNAPTVGVIDATNSLVGGSSNSNGYFYMQQLGYGNSIGVVSSDWGPSNNGMATIFTSDGSIKPIGDMSSPIAGVLTGSANDRVGSDGFQQLNTAQFVLSSSEWGGGRGALTWGDTATGFGTASAVSEANSLVGHTTNDNLYMSSGEGSNYGQLANGAYYINMNRYNGTSNAVAFVTYGSVGDITTKAVIADTGGNSLPYYTSPINLGGGKYAVYFRGNGEGSVGQVYITDANPNGFGVPFTDIHFNDTAGSDATVTNGNITAMMAAGTNVLLQASNDINVNAAIVVPGGSGPTGGLKLEAGKSVNFNANVNTRNGNLDVIANSRDADGDFRDIGAGGITIASGVSVNAGTGTVNFTVDSEGIEAGNITINGALSGGTVTLTTPADVVVQTVGGATASISAQNLAVNATSMAVVADLAAASISTSGAVNINLVGQSSTLTMSGGSGNGASASIVSAGNATVSANTIELNGGSGANAYALLDPTNPGATMTISTIQLLLNGGSGDGSYAALVSTGGDLTFVNPLPTIFFNPGTGLRADAVIYAPNGDVLARQFSLPYLGENSPFSNQLRDSGFAKYRLPYNLDQGDFLSGLDFIFDELSQRWRRRSSVNGVIAACSA